MSEWHLRAACRGQGPDDFIRGPRSDYGKTRQLCEACPVRQHCLDYALKDDSLTGLWGGTTDVERREIRRRARITPAIFRHLMRAHAISARRVAAL